MPHLVHNLKLILFEAGVKYSLPHIGAKHDKVGESPKMFCTSCHTTMEFMPNGLTVHFFNFLTGAAYRKLCRVRPWRFLIDQ